MNKELADIYKSADYQRETACAELAKWKNGRLANLRDFFVQGAASPKELPLFDDYKNVPVGASHPQNGQTIDMYVLTKMRDVLSVNPDKHGATLQAVNGYLDEHSKLQQHKIAVAKLNLLKENLAQSQKDLKQLGFKKYFKPKAWAMLVKQRAQRKEIYNVEARNAQAAKCQEMMTAYMAHINKTPLFGDIKHCLQQGKDFKPTQAYDKKLRNEVCLTKQYSLNLAACVSLVDAHSPDLVLLDIMRDPNMLQEFLADHKGAQATSIDAAKQNITEQRLTVFQYAQERYQTVVRQNAKRVPDLENMRKTKSPPKAASSALIFFVGK